MKGKGFPIIGGVVGGIVLPFIYGLFISPIDGGGTVDLVTIQATIFFFLVFAFIGFGIGAFVEQKIRK